MFVPDYKDTESCLGCLGYLGCVIIAVLDIVIFISVGYVIGYKSAKTKYKASPAVVSTNDSIKILFEKLDSLENEKD